MTVNITSPMILFWGLDFHHQGWYTVGGVIHRTPGDKVGGRLRFFYYSPPTLGGTYCRGVVTRGGDSIGYKRVLLPYSRQSGG